jgi:hypothetical protein
MKPLKKVFRSSISSSSPRGKRGKTEIPPILPETKVFDCGKPVQNLCSTEITLWKKPAHPVIKRSFVYEVHG